MQPVKQLNPLVVTASTIILAAQVLLAPYDVQAGIVHSAEVAYTSPDGFTIEHEDGVSGATSADINRDILATLAGDFGFVSASAGRFGNVGVEGELQDRRFLGARVNIGSDEHVNLTDLAQRATANFIIDGGFFEMFTLNMGSTVSYTLELTSKTLANGVEIGSREFLSEGMVESTSAGLNAVFTGEDIGATFTSSAPPGFASFGGRIDIPLSFQSLDLGIVPSGGVIDLQYEFETKIDSPFGLEGVRFGFSDPADVSGFGDFPIVTFSPAGTVIPEPSSWILLGLGSLGGSGLVRKTRNKRPGR